MSKSIFICIESYNTVFILSIDPGVSSKQLPCKANQYAFTPIGLWFAWVYPYSGKAQQLVIPTTFLPTLITQLTFFHCFLMPICISVRHITNDFYEFCECSIEGEHSLGETWAACSDLNSTLIMKIYRINVCCHLGWPCAGNYSSWDVHDRSRHYLNTWWIHCWLTGSN